MRKGINWNSIKLTNYSLQECRMKLADLVNETCCRPFVKPSSWLFILLSVLYIHSGLKAQQVNAQTDIGSRRELFIDDYLVAQLTGEAEIRLHQPCPQELVLKCDNPWEGSGSLYFSMFKDGDIYRMYYRGLQVRSFKKGHKRERDGDMEYKYCYAESRDGVHWVKPNLGIYKYNGKKKNNIILMKSGFGDFTLNLGDNASFFKDDNPAAPPDEKYKAFVCGNSPRGMYIFKSADAIHWQPMLDKPVITDGAFDSQNVVFWDSVRNEYRAYWRIFVNGIRAVRTARSKDFINWTDHEDLTYSDHSPYHLYTNQILPYYRAPYLFIGFPTRYVDRGWSPSMEALPELEYRKKRSAVSAREGTAVTETIIMASTQPAYFRRWQEAFLRPGIERPGTWNYGHQYMSWGILETASKLEGAPNEISLYASEEYKSELPIGTRLRRYNLRLDGFASVHAGMKGGSLVTKPIRFEGKALWLNFSSSAAGNIAVEILDENGVVIPGFSQKDCAPVFGDAIDRMVVWNSSQKLGSLAGRIVRLRFYINDADLYAFQFR